MKCALVTGGSRGIGRAVCIRLAGMGYYVIVNYLSNDAEARKTLDLIREAGSDGELLKFDVSDNAAAVSAIEGWQDAHPDTYIEVLVNNAGIRKDTLMLWMEFEDWTKVLGTGLDAFYNVTRPILRPMLVKRYGRIINMASLSGLKGLPGQCNYSAAKGGLIAATRALALEVGRKGVTVNAVAPGFVRTDMVDGLDEAELRKTIPVNRFGEPEEVFGAVRFLCSDASKFITGTVLAIDGGFSCFSGV